MSLRREVSALDLN